MAKTDSVLPGCNGCVSKVSSENWTSSIVIPESSKMESSAHDDVVAVDPEPVEANVDEVDEEVFELESSETDDSCSSKGSAITDSAITGSAIAGSSMTGCKRIIVHN